MSDLKDYPDEKIKLREDITDEDRMMIAVILLDKTRKMPFVDMIDCITPKKARALLDALIVSNYKRPVVKFNWEPKDNLRADEALRSGHEKGCNAEHGSEMCTCGYQEYRQRLTWKLKDK